MAQYKYTALSRGGGNRITGVIEGFNEVDAAARLKQDCDVIIKLEEVRSKDESGIAHFFSQSFGGAKFDGKAFTIMCSKLATILQSGVPVARAVSLVADKTTDKSLKKILDAVGQDVEAGRSISTSFADHGENFLPATFIETVRAGEESGELAKSFSTMSEHFDKQTKMRSKVRGALAYPLFVLLVAIVVVIVIMMFVMPTFTDIFANFDAQLPASTQLLINISEFMRNHWLVLLAVIAALVLAYKLYSNTEDGRMKVSELVLKVPVMGDIIMLNASSQFSNSLATLLDSGLSLSKALPITARTIDNYYISSQLGSLAVKLEEGQELGAAMREQDLMPDILVDMISIGEETGELTDTLNTIGAYYDNELNESISSIMAKLEPALLIVMAVIVGFVVISVYVAMFEMYDAM